MPKNKKFAKISFIAALLSATSGVQAQNMNSFYPAMPYQTSQGFNNPNQQMQNQNFYPNVQQQFPAQNVQLPNYPANPTYYQNQVPPVQQIQPAYFPNNVASYPTNVTSQQAVVSPNQPIQPKANSNTKQQSTNKIKDKSSVTMDKITSSLKNAPLKTFVGMILGAITGGGSGKNFSFGRTAIGAIAGLAAGAAADYFTGDLLKSIKAIKEIWGFSNKSKNVTNSQAPSQPVLTNNNPASPSASPVPQITAEQVTNKPIVMDPELQALVDKLADLQRKYIGLMYDMKYSDDNNFGKKALFTKINELEDYILRKDNATKFAIECSYCVNDIRISQIKKNTRFNFTDQVKILKYYLSRIPTLYSRKELEDVIPRVEKCLAKLMEFKKDQIDTKSKNDKNNSKKSNYSDKKLKNSDESNSKPSNVDNAKLESNTAKSNNDGNKDSSENSKDKIN